MKNTYIDSKESILTEDLGEIIKQSPEMALALIKKGANVNVDVNHLPLFAYAIQNKKQDIIDALLRREDLNINAMVHEDKEDGYSDTPLLIYAIEQQDFTTVQKLLANNTLNILKLKITSGDGHITNKNILNIAVESKNLEL